MTWEVVFHDEFRPEYRNLPKTVANKFGRVLRRLQADGPNLNRPMVDTLKGSNYKNLKEIRINLDEGQWRFAFVFDPKRRAIILIASNKAGVDQRRF